jgi:hypothetical protein
MVRLTSNGLILHNYSPPMPGFFKPTCHINHTAVFMNYSMWKRNDEPWPISEPTYHVKSRFYCEFKTRSPDSREKVCMQAVNLKGNHYFPEGNSQRAMFLPCNIQYQRDQYHFHVLQFSVGGSTKDILLVSRHND